LEFEIGDVSGLISEQFAIHYLLCEALRPFTTLDDATDIGLQDIGHRVMKEATTASVA
jgi:hypothetical protein